MKRLTIVIDAGHGGIDPGATGNGLKEKNRALDYALKIGRELERLGFNVIYTRTKDQFIELRDRARISNNSNGVLFISIHLNSFSDSNAIGLETLYHPTSFKGKEIANRIQNEMVKNSLCNKDRGIKPRENLYVLRATKAPAVLVELGFISNKKDVELLANKEVEIVQSITKAISQYLGVDYVPPIKESSKEDIDKPYINLVEGKINLMLMAEHVAINGFIKDGVSYISINGVHISIREIFEKMNLKVGWDDKIRIITIDTSGEFIKEEGLMDVILLGNKINVKTYKHDSKYCLKINNAYIPIRNLFETLGFKVDWDNKNNMILINK